MKTPVLPFTILIAVGVYSCNNAQQESSAKGEDKKTDSQTNVNSDTLKTKRVKAFSVNKVFVGDSMMKRIQEAAGAPRSVTQSLVVESNEWANNLDDLVGRIVRVEADENGQRQIVDVLKNITTSQYTPKVITPVNPEIEDRLIQKEKALELGFMGIGLEIKDNQVFKYKATNMAFTRVLDRDIDANKVPDSYKCTGDQCSYYYINSASVKTCETTLFTEKGKKVSADDIPIGGAAIPFKAKVYTANTMQDYHKKNLVFCTLLRLP
ncbi:hypothetical protein GCM10027594_05140 [Hymenobacter agri]